MSIFEDDFFLGRWSEGRIGVVSWLAELFVFMFGGVKGTFVLDDSIVCLVFLSGAGIQRAILASVFHSL